MQTLPTFRFYPSLFPEVDEIVMIKVKNITDIGVYVYLLEYNNLMGLILFSDLSRRRVRHINNVVREGTNEVAMVIRVDVEKGYIDLSKKNVTSEEVQECEERFAKSKLVHSIVCDLCFAEKKYTEQYMQSLYETIIWPLFSFYGHADKAFSLYIKNNVDIFEKIPLSTEKKEALLKCINKRYQIKPFVIRSHIQLNCYTYEGINAIKKALFCGLEYGNRMIDESNQLQIKLLVSPFYSITLYTYDKTKGAEIIKNIMNEIKKCIDENKGSFLIEKDVYLVDEKEDDKLKQLLEKINKEESDIDGDQDNESSSSLSSLI